MSIRDALDRAPNKRAGVAKQHLPTLSFSNLEANPIGGLSHRPHLGVFGAARFTNEICNGGREGKGSVMEHSVSNSHTLLSVPYNCTS